MRRRMMIWGGLAVMGAGIAAAFGWRRRRGPPPPDAPPLAQAAFDALYDRPLAPPAGPMRVFHLGHSLVGRDMPAMLAQLAGAGHGHESQLGWGASLRAHWEPDAPVAGFEAENAHPRFRPAKAALASGDYDAVVLTEMVEIRDAIRWHASPAYLALWAQYARQGNPAIRVYLYETWHQLDDPGGWLARIDADLGRYWEGVLLRGAAARPGGAPIWLIPAGQVMARAARAAEAGEIPGIARREAFFARDATGEQDMIHMSDVGAYLVALTHYAVLYHRSPEGLPHALLRADGSPAEAPSPEAARALQRLVWDVARRDRRTGIAPA